MASAKETLFLLSALFVRNFLNSRVSKGSSAA